MEHLTEGSSTDGRPPLANFLTTLEVHRRNHHSTALPFMVPLYGGSYGSRAQTQWVVHG